MPPPPTRRSAVRRDIPPARRCEWSELPLLFMGIPPFSAATLRLQYRAAVQQQPVLPGKARGDVACAICKRRLLGQPHPNGQAIRLAGGDLVVGRHRPVVVEGVAEHVQHPLVG